MIRIVALIAVTAVLTMVALATFAPGPSDGEGYGDSEGGPLVARVLSDDRYSVGEPVTLILEVKNTSDNLVVLSYEHKQPYRFWINYDLTGGDEIFTAWYSPFTSAPVAPVRELGGGEKLVFRIIWDQTDLSGRVVPPGIYDVQGRHMGGCESE